MALARSSRVGRYLSCAFRTVALLRRKQPSLLFVQNPSLVLAALAVTWGRLFRVPVVVDAHNAALIACEEGSSLLRALARHSLRHAALVLVSNANLLPIVGRVGGRGFVLPDPIPDVGAGRPHDKGDRAMSCTSARSRRTNRRRSAGGPAGPARRGNAPLRQQARGCLAGKRGVRPHRNAVLTGFLPEREYLRSPPGGERGHGRRREGRTVSCAGRTRRLRSANRSSCPTRKPSEPISHGEPDVMNEPADIAAKINEAVACGSLTSGIIALRRELDEVWGAAAARSRGPWLSWAHQGQRMDPRPGGGCREPE